MSSKDLLEKYEYLTGEDLGHKPSVSKQAKFECSLLGMVLTNNTKKTRIQIGWIARNNKGNIWYIIPNIVLQCLMILMNLKNYHLVLCTKDWMTFRKDLIGLELLIHKEITIKF